MLPSELGCPPITKQGSRDSGFRDVANLRHRAMHSRDYTKDKQRFVMSVVAYDSLPGHQNCDFSTLEYDFVRSRLPDGWREKRSADFSSITLDLQWSMVGFADFT
jgi:hypothetical protein